VEMTLSLDITFDDESQTCTSIADDLAADDAFRNLLEDSISNDIAPENGYSMGTLGVTCPSDRRLATVNGTMEFLVTFDVSLASQTVADDFQTSMESASFQGAMATRLVGEYSTFLAASVVGVDVSGHSLVSETATTRAKSQADDDDNNDSDRLVTGSIVAMAIGSVLGAPVICYLLYLLGMRLRNRDKATMVQSLSTDTRHLLYVENGGTPPQNRESPSCPSGSPVVLTAIVPDDRPIVAGIHCSLHSAD